MKTPQMRMDRLLPPNLPPNLEEAEILWIEAQAKIERLRAALEPLAKVGLWRDHYEDGPDRLTNQTLGRLFTVEQVREARRLTTDQQRVAPSYGCVFCDLKLPLHEDAEGFHHVAEGERILCALQQSAQEK